MRLKLATPACHLARCTVTRRVEIRDSSAAVVDEDGGWMWYRFAEVAVGESERLFLGI